MERRPMAKRTKTVKARAFVGASGQLSEASGQGSNSFRLSTSPPASDKVEPMTQPISKHYILIGRIVARTLVGNRRASSVALRRGLPQRPCLTTLLPRTPFSFLIYLFSNFTILSLLSDWCAAQRAVLPVLTSLPLALQSHSRLVFR